MTTLNLKTPTGKSVTAELGEYLDRPSFRSVAVEGEPYGYASGRIFDPPANAPAGVAGILMVPSSGMIGLDRESVDMAQRAIDVLTAEIEARPEVRMGRLIAEREALINRISGLLEDDADRRDRAWERGDEDGTFGVRDGGAAAKLSQETDAARAALSSFDAEYPEVIEEIRRREDEATRRFLASN